jgi:hypothetical protein
MRLEEAGAAKNFHLVRRYRIEKQIRERRVSVCIQAKLWPGLEMPRGRKRESLHGEAGHRLSHEKG